MKLLDRLTSQAVKLKNKDKSETIKLARRLSGCKGIEIGGPSSFFKEKGYYPAYIFADTIDGVNFSTKTVWEGSLQEGPHFHYKDGYNNGYQYISEGATLDKVPANTYDFLLSCHSLEHIANPLKALKRWNAVLKTGGTFCLIVPNKEHTFDKNRPYTQFEHLLNDEAIDTPESDDTHFEEIFKNHITETDPGINNFEELRTRTLDNYNNRCVHHHVFNFSTIKQMLEYAKFDVGIQKTIHNIHLFTLATKIAD